MERERVLERWAGEAREVLGNGLLACWALPAPGPFVAVVAERPQGATEELLRSVHRTSPPHDALHGSYAPVADLRSPMTVGRAWLRVEPGSTELLATARDNTVHARWSMVHDARVLLGAPPTSLVHDVEARALRAEAVGIARARAELVEEHPGLLDDPGYRRELVGAMCQVLHSAHEARVVVPSVAVRWARAVVPDGYREVVTGDSSGAADPALVRAFVWEVHRLVGAEVVRHTSG